MSKDKLSEDSLFKSVVLILKKPEEQKWSIKKQSPGRWVIKGPFYEESLSDEAFLVRHYWWTIPKEVWREFQFHVESHKELNNNQVRSKSGHIFTMDLNECTLRFTRATIFFCLTKEELDACEWLDDENKEKAIELLDQVLYLKANGKPKE